MRKPCFVVALVAGFIFATDPASADVITVFTATPDIISPGDQSLIDLQLTLTPDGANFGPAFVGGTAVLYSGTGALVSFDIGTGGTFRDFSYSFTYPDSGIFEPAFSVTADHTE